MFVCVCITEVMVLVLRYNIKDTKDTTWNAETNFNAVCSAARRDITQVDDASFHDATCLLMIVFKLYL